MRKALFMLSYGAMYTTPLYAVAAIILAAVGAPAWAALLPVFLIYIPATAYLMSRRCPNCRSLIYTTEHLKSAPAGWRRFPMPVFHACLDCQHTFPDPKAV